MEQFSLKPDEKLLVNDPYASWMKTEMMAIPGSLKLTDKRLVFVKNANQFAGPLKWFIKSMRSQVLHEYPLTSIKSFSRETHFKSEWLVIDNGIERPKKFMTPKIEVLEAELKRLTGK
jgi:hypothetical protein